MRVRILALLLAVVVAGGCGREERAEADFQVEQRVAATRAGLSLERARELVAEVGGVAPKEVTVMHRSVDGRVATILAAVPAAERVLAQDAVEVIDLRWDLDYDLPLNVLWSERIQLAAHESTSPEEAAEVAQKLLERWGPKEAGEIMPSQPQKLQVPVYMIAWAGMIEGNLTGDQGVVQVSAVTGLPISFSQRIAWRRTSLDEIEVTRDEALEIVREYLQHEGVPNAASVNLVAQLNLSTPVQPEGGPAWLVAVIDVEGRQKRVLPVDAQTGEVLLRDSEQNGRQSGRTNE